MREALVDIFVDDIGLMEHQVAFDQHRHLIVGIHDRQIFWLVLQVNVDDLEIHALFKQHDTAALAEWTGGSGIEGHHGFMLPLQS